MGNIKKIVGAVWRILPPFARQTLVRTTQNKFTVSVTAVIQDEKGRILLLDHVLRPQSGWGTPGGFIEPNEQPEDAIRRELKEEIGLELSDVEQVWVRTIQKHVEIVFSAKSAGDLKVQSAEIHSAKWFPVSELPAEMSRVQKFVITKTLSYTLNKSS
jgi:ADP-ribose pyrophosphatase YjhB (NUDIX family)